MSTEGYYVIVGTNEDGDDYTVLNHEELGEVNAFWGELTLEEAVEFHLGEKK